MKYRIITSSDIDRCPIGSFDIRHYNDDLSCKCQETILLINIKVRIDPTKVDRDFGTPTIDALMGRIYAQVSDQDGVVNYTITDNLPTPDQLIPADKP